MSNGQLTRQWKTVMSQHYSHAVVALRLKTPRLSDGVSVVKRISDNEQEGTRAFQRSMS